MQSIEIPSIPAECAATSIGTANNLLLTMFKLLIYAQCKVSPPDMWPQDRGEVALKEGMSFNRFITAKTCKFVLRLWMKMYFKHAFT